MKIRYLTLLTTLVFLGFTVSAIAKGKPTKPPVDSTVVYTVELTTGVFTFDAHEVTLNSRGYLKSFDTFPLEFKRPGVGFSNEQRDAWDDVIDNCAGPLVGTFTDEDVMLVNFDEWAVGRNGDDGNLWINFKNIRLPSSLVPEKEIQIQLQLRDDPATQTFLPAIGSELAFDLNWYVVWGKPLSGSDKGKNKGWDTCYHVDDVDPEEVFLPAKLVIKYIRVVN
jgi:hypothetical protein